MSIHRSGEFSRFALAALTQTRGNLYDFASELTCVEIVQFGFRDVLILGEPPEQKMFIAGAALLNAAIVAVGTSAFGAKPEILCSMRALRVLTHLGHRET
jgi:hypothetical protein